MKNRLPDGLSERVRRLRRDDRGIPIPWFVTNGADGQPIFRHVEKPRFLLALKRRCCWICGEPLGAYMAFITGPAGVINRITHDPAMHRECAQAAMQICPFLSEPAMGRAPRPTDVVDDDGLDPTNPGIAVIYVTRGYEVLRVHGDLISLNAPTAVEWWKKRRLATRSEASAALDTAIRTLGEIAATEGQQSMRDLVSNAVAASALLPPDVAVKETSDAG